jgi:two-component system OmpR family response regulator
MILMVDDSAEDCERFRRELAGAGYPVHCTRTARDALQVMETMRPGLLVVDLVMPDVDGFELVRRVREKAGVRDVPVMVYTVVDTPEGRERARGVGADDYVVKGALGAAELRERVGRLYRAGGAGMN